MRYFAVLLALFVSYLVCMPCTDADTCEYENGHDVGHHHEHSDDSSDTCSPFCVCSCCGLLGAVIEITIFKIPYFGSTAKVLYFTNYIDGNSTYLFSFWQPPKI